MRMLVIMAIALAAAGCSDDSDGGAGDDRVDNQSTSTAPTLTFSDVCLEVEANLPTAGFGFPANDRQRADYGNYADGLRPLVDQIEEPQRSVLALYVADIDYVVQLPEDPYIADNGEIVLPGLEADEMMIEARDRMRSACADAGTPIFQ